jgi:PAS domain S-box-containing protein
MSLAVNILVIEDNENDYELVVKNIKKSGLAVFSRRIETAEEMQAALDHEVWDIVISDYSLPSFNAPSALKMLIRTGKDIPFIVVSGTISEETAIELMRSGASDYLMKDRLARLGPLVKRELNIAQVRKEREESRAALWFSQDWFNLIYKTTSDAMFLLTIDSGNVYRFKNVNMAFLSFTGLKLENLIGKRMDEIIPAQIASSHLAKFDEAIEKRQVLQYEAPIDFPQRKLIVRVTVTPIFDMNEQCTHLLGAAQDITDFKNAETLLQEKERKYSTAFYLSPDSININRLKDGLYIEINRGFTNLTGYTEEDVKNKTSLELDIWANPDDRKRLVKGLQEKGSVFNLQAPFRCKDGSIITCLMSAQNIEVNGEPCLLSITRDITDYVKAQKAIEENEARYRVIFEQSPDGMVILDPDTGKILEFNDVAHRQLGYDHAEFSRLSVSDIDVKESSDEVLTHIKKISAIGYADFETLHRTKNGEIRNVQVNAHVINPYSHPIYHCIWRDITQAKQAEDEVCLNAKRVQILLHLHNMTDRTVKEITDYALESAVSLTQSSMGYLAFLNEDESVMTMYSWSKRAMEKCGIIDKPIDYSVEEAGLWGEAVRQRKPIITNDYSAPNPLKKGVPHGHVPLLRHLNLPIFANEHIVLVIGVANKATDYNESDINQLTLMMDGLWLILEKMRSEKELKHYQEHLEELVEERTQQLSALNQELEAFSYSVSHDLRAPLRAVTGFSELLKDEYEDKLDDQGVQYIQTIQNAAHKMETLITDLLNLSRITRADITHQQVNLSILANEIALEINEHDSQRRVSFEIIPDIIVQGDESLLKIALENLINNAYKFTARCDSANIQVGVSEEKGERIYYVRDNGIGFNMEYAGKLFAPFQRLHRSQDFAGTGIGLSIVQRIITRHGGRIWAEAAVNQGATFYFTLGDAKSDELSKP